TAVDAVVEQVTEDLFAITAGFGGSVGHGSSPSRGSDAAGKAAGRESVIGVEGSLTARMSARPGMVPHGSIPAARTCASLRSKVKVRRPVRMLSATAAICSAPVPGGKDTHRVPEGAEPRTWALIPHALQCSPTSVAAATLSAGGVVSR